MKSLDKKEANKLEWEKEFEKWWLDSDRFGSNSENWTLLHDDTLAYIQSLLTQQRTELLEKILEENFCDLDGTYDYDGIAKSVIDLHKKL